ncbi:hypothetical protein [Actinoplanes couchii]|uniref:Knr4/Smi1-like domain-containing protein n=1 Tax=Actinoplanes couchii TaxID=403638 RepID=A0ABQ3XR15_9ACTN|nr:hypothetical protein [Actinoplanes couchii]MDR6318167.1 hypothetical protein [Actinoplanes couchii]GID60961.1 hypothetical protein Aco03nite_093650 [Actinoplanes couchii]
MTSQVRGLAVPPLLLSLIEEGRWQHPGEVALARVMPWFEDPLHFLTDLHAMAGESKSLDFLTDDALTAQLFRQARGTERAAPVELPWLDVDKAVLIAVNERAGDDVAVALDYRTGPADPRVVASDFWTGPGPCSWRQVTPTFSAFVTALGL